MAQQQIFPLELHHRLLFNRLEVGCMETRYNGEKYHEDNATILCKHGETSLNPAAYRKPSPLNVICVTSRSDGLRASPRRLKE
jgi:hypothetical protein